MEYPPVGHPHYMSDEAREALYKPPADEDEEGMDMSTSTAAQQYKELRVKIAEAKKTMKETAEKLFSEMAVGFFEENPTLVNFGWTQFTPYWCDGDVCEFSANTEYPNTSITAPNGKVLTYDDNRGELLADGEEVDDDSLYEPEEIALKKLATKVGKFMKVFEEEDLETMFGDHVKVTVNRNGTVDTEEFEHE